MSAIVAISGTPKVKDSATAALIAHIEKVMGTPVTTHQATRLIRAKDPSSAIVDIVAADVVLFAFPLYVDSLPAPLIKVMTMLEASVASSGADHRPRVYAVCNCGFYESSHNELALDIVANFCDRTDWAWRYGIGIGSGGFISTAGGSSPKGPAANVFAALDAMVQAIQADDGPRPNAFVTPKMPRLLYRLGADWGWRTLAKKYHASKLLKARPYAP